MLIDPKQIRGPYGTPYAIVYRQGAVSDPAIGLYGDFPSAFDAALLLADPFLILQGNGVVPPGTYELPSQLMVLSVDFATLDMQDGATLISSLPLATLTFQQTSLTWASTVTPAIQVTTGQLVVSCMFSFFGPDTGATAPLFETTGSAVLILAGTLNTTFTGTLAALLIEHQSSSVAQVWLSQFGSISNAALGGNGSYSVTPFDNSVSYTTDQPGTNILYQPDSGTPELRVVATNLSGQSIQDGGVLTTVTNWTASTNESPAPSGGSFVEATGVTTIPIEGAYLFVQAQVEFSAAASVAGGEFTASIVQNGSVVKQSVNTCPVAGSTTKRTVDVGTWLMTSQGDTVVVQVSQSSGSGPIPLTASATRNVLSIGYAPS